ASPPSDARKTLAGHDAHEVVLTVTAWEHGKAIEQDGGWIVTSDLWIADAVHSLDALRALERQYAVAVSDVAFTGIDVDYVAIIDAMYPEFVPVAARALQEAERLGGTVLAQSTKYDMVRTAKETARAAKEQQRLGSEAGARVLGDPSSRTTLVMFTEECLALDVDVSDADVALPDGLRKVKRPH